MPQTYGWCRSMHRLPSRIVRTSLLASLSAALCRNDAVGLTSSFLSLLDDCVGPPDDDDGGRYAAAVEVNRGMILIATWVPSGVSWLSRIEKNAADRQTFSPVTAEMPSLTLPMLPAPSVLLMVHSPRTRLLLVLSRSLSLAGFASAAAFFSLRSLAGLATSFAAASVSVPFVTGTVGTKVGCAIASPRSGESPSATRSSPTALLLLRLTRRPFVCALGVSSSTTSSSSSRSSCGSGVGGGTKLPPSWSPCSDPWLSCTPFSLPRPCVVVLPPPD